jgi:hypothetical protein
MLFISRKKSYKLILQAKRFLLSRDGEKVLMPGKKIIFQGGNFETHDKELIKELKNTKYFGVDYFVAAGEGEENEPTPQGKALESEHKQAAEDTLRSCPHCAFSTTTKTALMSHIRAKHPDKVVSK